MANKLESTFREAFAVFEQNKSAPKKKVPIKTKPGHKTEKSSSDGQGGETNFKAGAANFGRKKAVPVKHPPTNQSTGSTIQGSGQNLEDYMGMAFDEEIDVPQEEYAAIDVDQKEAFEQQQEDYENVVFDSLDTGQQSQADNNKTLTNKADTNQQEIYANTPLISGNSQPEEELYANLGANVDNTPGSIVTPPGGTTQEAHVKPPRKTNRQVPAPPSFSSKSPNPDKKPNPYSELIDTVKSPPGDVLPTSICQPKVSSPTQKAGKSVPPPPKKCQNVLRENLYAEPRETAPKSQDNQVKLSSVPEKNKKVTLSSNIYGPEPGPEPGPELGPEAGITEVPEITKLSVRKSLLGLITPRKPRGVGRRRTSGCCISGYILLPLLLLSLAANTYLALLAADVFADAAAAADADVDAVEVNFRNVTTTVLADWLTRRLNLESSAKKGLLLNVASMYLGTRCFASSKKKRSECQYAIDGRDTTDLPNYGWDTTAPQNKGAWINLELRTRARIVAAEFIQPCDGGNSSTQRINMEFISNGTSSNQTMSLERKGNVSCDGVMRHMFLVDQAQPVDQVNITMLPTNSSEGQTGNMVLVEVRLLGYGDVVSHETCCPDKFPVYSPGLRRCYHFSNITETRNQSHALQECQTLGADLLAINSKHEEDFLRPELVKKRQDAVKYVNDQNITDESKRNEYTNWWLGLKCLGTPTNIEDWWWSSSLPLKIGTSYLAWNHGEPSDHRYQHCAELFLLKNSSSYVWNNLRCDSTRMYICERESLC